MRSPKELTRAEIVRAASHFRWTRKGAKWTVIVGERELPARPLVLEAAGVLRMTRQTRTRPSRYCGDSDLRLATPGSRRK